MKTMISHYSVITVQLFRCLSFYILFDIRTSTMIWKGLICYNCPEINHPRFCNHVQRCNDGEICSLTRSVDSYGDKTFQLGCMAANLCNANIATNGSPKCYHCCSTDLCNSYGCGEIDHRFGNSSICYQCNGQLVTEPCHNIEFCDNNEMCYESEEMRFDEKYIQTGCKHILQCQALHYQYPAIGKRDRVVRSTIRTSCCIGDLTEIPPVKYTSISYETNGKPSTTASDKITATHYITTVATIPAMNTAQAGTVEAMHGESTKLPDFKGQDFILLFFGGRSDFYNRGVKVLTMGGAGQFLVHYFKQNRQKIITIGENKNEHTFENDLTIIVDGLQQTGIQLNANVETTVYGFIFNDNTHHCDGYLGIPSQYLSQKYIVPSFKVYGNTYARSVIALTPRDSTTTVNITFKMIQGAVSYNGTSYYENDTLTVVIKRFESFEISHTYDLTGTEVSSSHPIAVFSGTKCKASSPNIGCTSFIEMVLPIEQLDKTYIIPFIDEHSNSTLRVISIMDTTVTFESFSESLKFNIGAKDYMDFDHKEISYVHATSPVSVLIYPEPDHYGDEFMMTIHGTNQYLNNYNFVAPTGYNSYISVTVSSGDLRGFLLNGKLLDINNINAIRVGNETYSTFSMPVTNGGHRLEHSKNVRFGLWIYGKKLHRNTYKAYGYPAGIDMKGARL